MKPDAKDQYGEEQAHRIAYLVAGFLRKTLSEKEHDELDAWITSSDENQELFEELIDPANIEKGLAEYDKPDAEAALARIKTKIKFVPEREKENGSKRRRIFRYSIAASILLLAGTITIILVKNKKDITGGITKTEKQDIKPGGNKATLTLTNGKSVDLEEAKKGLIDSANGSDALKTAEGQLSYESNANKGEGYHILTTPAGGQYSVTLPDGTRVWLNASSSLKYPVVFDGKERVVELSGEGYFEAAPSSSPQGGEGTSSSSSRVEMRRKIPFIVRLKNGAQVEVVGTHFNINAYDDEKVIETTLLEGKVEVGGRKSEVSRELMPGEQGRLLRSARNDGSARNEVASPGARNEVASPGARNDGGGEWSVVSGVDTSLAVAWKNGKFQFKDAPIETIMRQVSRWYDAEIVYEGKVDYHFNATIYRKENVSKLLELLEGTERVHFVIEGRRIVVRP